MKLQDAKHSCGPTALSNALEAIGRPLEVSACAELCGTTVDGTDEHDLAKGMTLLGFSPRVVTSWPALIGWLVSGVPAIACVDSDEHWVAVIGNLRDRLIVVDSASGELVKTYASDEWSRRWRGSEGFYALALHR